MKIDPITQSLILPGESPEADRRFERALRLNGSGHSARFTVVAPPTSIEAATTGAAMQALKPSAATVVGTNEIPVASRGTVRRDSRRWRELYRIVTQGDNSSAKGGKVDVVV